MFNYICKALSCKESKIEAKESKIDFLTRIFMTRKLVKSETDRFETRF